MSLQTRLGDLITAIGTDIKAIRTFITGTSGGSYSGMSTTSTNVIGAINEIYALIGSASIPDATTAVKGKVELATDAETITGTDTVRAVTPSNITAKIDTDTSLAGNSDTRIPSQKAVKAYADAITVADASATVKGKVELATDAEAITGTDTVRATTPANIAAVFTDRIDTTTTLGSSNTKVPSQLAVKTYADALLELNDVLQFKGAIDASANPNYPAANKGHFYKISVAGKIGGASGPNVEAGDSIYCITDGSAAGNQATVGANWVIVQVNLDGAVIGPASSTNLAIAIYSGTTGKLISDSAVVISIDGTFAANSDAKVPTEKAVKTYVAATNYTKSELGDPDTDLAAAYATAKA